MVGETTRRQNNPVGNGSGRTEKWAKWPVTVTIRNKVQFSIYFILCVIILVVLFDYFILFLFYLFIVWWSKLAELQFLFFLKASWRIFVAITLNIETQKSNAILKLCPLYFKIVSRNSAFDYGRSTRTQRKSHLCNQCYRSRLCE